MGLKATVTCYCIKGGQAYGWKETKTDYEKMQHKFQPMIRQGRLKTVNAFITKDNVDALIRSAGFSGEIGLLSIDVDGNDYYIWEAVHAVDPAVVVIEYI